jgi:hypothetical protein
MVDTPLLVLGGIEHWNCEFCPHAPKFGVVNGGVCGPDAKPLELIGADW